MARTRDNTVVLVGIGVAAGAAVVGLLLPWSSNSIVGDEGASDILLGDDGVILATLIFAVALPLAIVGLLVGTRQALVGAAAAAGAALFGLYVCAGEIRSHWANSIGENIETGEMLEDWADSQPAAGFYLFLLAVVIVLLLATYRLLRSRRTAI
jgi:hypothetical protein